MADTFSCDSPADTAEISFKVICTELYRQGFMSDAWHRADEEFGAQMPDTVIRGYRFLALPVVEYMKISPTFTTFISYFAIPWAQEMAYQGGVESEGSIVGKAVFVIGVPISWVVGLFVP
jgi:hypothetical protein